MEMVVVVQVIGEWDWRIPQEVGLVWWYGRVWLECEMVFASLSSAMRWWR